MKKVFIFRLFKYAMSLTYIVMVQCSYSSLLAPKWKNINFIRNKCS